MLVHVVLWQLLDEACDRSKVENLIEMKQRFEALQYSISEIQDIAVFINEIETCTNADIMLVVKFKNIQGLNLYMNHNAHKELSQWVSKIRKTRIALDYVE